MRRKARNPRSSFTDRSWAAGHSNLRTWLDAPGRRVRVTRSVGARTMPQSERYPLRSSSASIRAAAERRREQAATTGPDASYRRLPGSGTAEAVVITRFAGNPEFAELASLPGR